MRTLLETLPPTFTTRVARELGVHPRDLYAWRDHGDVIELSRGVFRRGDAPPASHPDALAMAHRAPQAIVCCLSAAEADTFELGLSSFEAAIEEQVRVYDPARTVVDLMRLRHRFGEPIAHSALHRFITVAGARPALLLDYAQALGVFGPMRAAIDIASAR